MDCCASHNQLLYIWQSVLSIFCHYRPCDMYSNWNVRVFSKLELNLYIWQSEGYSVTAGLATCIQIEMYVYFQNWSWNCYIFDNQKDILSLQALLHLLKLKCTCMCIFKTGGGFVILLCFVIYYVNTAINTSIAPPNTVERITVVSNLYS